MAWFHRFEDAQWRYLQILQKGKRELINKNIYNSTMERFKWVGIGGLVLFLLMPARVLAKDYSIEEADFTVQLNVNGRAEITETRVYNFDGSFSWAEMWINLAGKCVKSTSCPDYVISGITVTGDSDNFTTEIKNRQLYIKW